MTTFARDLKRPEGPVALPDGSFLVVEGGRGSVTRIMRGGRSTRVIATTGEPNGLAVDRAGAIWVADVRPSALIRLTMDGKFERVLMKYRDEPFMYPNDLCFGPDGALYLTDSGFFVDDLESDGVIRPDWKRLKMDGRIYRIDRRTLAIEKLADGIYLANGLAFGPDGALYVAETVGGAICRYAWNAGRLGPRQDFGNVLVVKDHADLVGPDGMAFDTNGKLYVAVAGQGDVTVLGRDGAVLERIRTPGIFPTNVCFGLPGEKKIYVTEYEQGHVECYDVDADGFPLYG
jgi:gluconolactonase